MNILSIADTVFSVGLIAGVFCLIASFVAAVFSPNRYEDEFWSFLILAGFVVAVVCGIVVLGIRSI